MSQNNRHPTTSLAPISGGSSVQSQILRTAQGNCPQFPAERHTGAIIQQLPNGTQPSIDETPVCKAVMEQFSQFLHWNNSIIYDILEVFVEISSEESNPRGKHPPFTRLDRPSQAGKARPVAPSDVRCSPMQLPSSNERSIPQGRCLYNQQIWWGHLSLRIGRHQIHPQAALQVAKLQYDLQACRFGKEYCRQLYICSN